MTQAVETPHVSRPPSSAQIWRFEAWPENYRLIRAQTWFAARRAAMRLLGCEMGSLRWCIVPPESLNGDANRVIDAEEVAES
jgi:hypothetical protein